VIRGRAEAYAYERQLVKTLQPELNDQYIGWLGAQKAL
jgi:hypothetical protein